jgi:hypothetical protein
MRKFVLSLILLSTVGARAYIPSSRMILDRVVEKSLQTPLFVEQMVTLTSSDQTVTVKEQWLFDSDNSIRLVVRGEKDLKDQINFQNLYTESQKTSSLGGLLQNQKLPSSLFERMFFIKSTDLMMKFLVQQGIAGEEIFRSQNFRKVGGNSGFQYQPEPFLRLARMAGGVAYVFGPAPKAGAATAGLWVEQDQFNLLKIRNGTGDELRVDKPTTFARAVRWPKNLTYAWGKSQAQVQVVNVRLAEVAQRQIFQMNSNKRTPDFERHTGKFLLEEFYQRFR